MTDPVEMNDVTLAFEENVGVFDLTMTIEPGIIFGLIGPSGCGKTTTIRLMLGLETPQQGTISILGKPPADFSIADREKIGYLPQNFVLYPTLSVRENMRFMSSLYGMNPFKRRSRIDELLDMVELTEAASRLVRDISGGMRRRLELACALLHDPQLLIFDEPTAGIDPVLRSKLWDYFQDLKDANRTLLVTTQYVGEAAYCDQIGVMSTGELITIDDPESIRYDVLGGETVELVVPESQVQAAEEVLRQLDMRVRRMPAAGHLHIHAEHAAGTIPRVVDTMREADIDIKAINEYTRSFDEVFELLMEENAHA